VLPYSSQRLPEAADGWSIETYQEWIDHNELELALDGLEGLGEINPVPREFWAHLCDAAREMGLGRHVLRLNRRLSESAG